MRYPISNIELEQDVIKEFSFSYRDSVFNSIFSNSVEEAVTVSTGGDVTEFNITDLIPFTSYTLYVEGVTVEIGDKSDDVMVMTLEDGEGVVAVVMVLVCVCVCVFV